MKLTMIGAALFATLMLAPGAQAAVMADANGMTLYTFDKDADGTSVCYDDCAVKWPPYLATEGATLGEGWATVDRTDGTKQLTYDGKPLYYFIEDKAAGDAAGDGLGGVWHVINE